MAPTYGNGKICYLELPATDVGRSSEFYREVFGWALRPRGDGRIAFDDGVGEVSGTWTTALKPSAAGILIYLMVDDARATLKQIVAKGGEVVEDVGAHPPEVTALFRDPAGNVLGLYQQQR
jgi:predicted enzyme related to lactoylglutathione lyase